MYDYPFFEVEKHTDAKVAILYLNRPEERNSMNWTFWRDLPLVVDDLESDPDVKVVILAARGKSFSTGLDLLEFKGMYEDLIKSENADQREGLYRLILKMQEGFNRMDQGSKVYIGAVHRHCIGGAVDLIAACDLRYATTDASFSIRETKVAIVADMGSLNRLGDVIGMGNLKELAFTGADFDASHAQRIGLVNSVFEKKEEMMKKTFELATEIASNPGLVLRGVKKILNYQRSHSVEDGLQYVAAWNAAFLGSPDFQEMMSAFLERRRPAFR